MAYRLDVFWIQRHFFSPWWHRVPWESWLIRSPHTRKIPSSSLGGTIMNSFFAGRVLYLWSHDSLLHAPLPGSGLSSCFLNFWEQSFLVCIAGSCQRLLTLPTFGKSCSIEMWFHSRFSVVTVNNIFYFVFLLREDSCGKFVFINRHSSCCSYMIFFVE